MNNLELFSGAGGLALGLHNAGIKNVALIDFYKDANNTVKENFPEWNVITEDLNNVAEVGIWNYIEKQNIDMLTGGFPCQPFSYAGKRLGLEDTRGTVFYSLAKIIRDVNPNIFMLENVKGLLNHDKGRTFKTIVEILEDLGYRLDYRVLNAWNYGVAQKRERLIIIGIKNKYQSTFTWPKEEDYKPVLKDVLKDVPDSQGRTYNEKKYAIIDMVPAGGCWVDLPEDVAKEYMGKSYYSGGGKRGMARRLSWDEPSLTLTTAPDMKQTERAHPAETRPLTVREYARIQSFPDWYVFTGGMTSQYKQIGNAVPVKLAEHLGKQLIELHKNIKREKVDDHEQLDIRFYNL